MSEPGSWPGSAPLLSGLFGVLQTAASQRLSTADVWSSLRQAAGSWAFSAQGGGPAPTISELEQSGARILSEQGVGIQQVNTYRALAGSWKSAAEHVQGIDPQDQITSRDIFVPPWAKTATSGVPDEYRVRVEWTITPTVGDSYTKWSSYQITSPLTNIADVIQQATTKAQGDRYIYQLSSGGAPDVNSYQIEQI